MINLNEFLRRATYSKRSLNSAGTHLRGAALATSTLRDCIKLWGTLRIRNFRDIAHELRAHFRHKALQFIERCPKNLRSLLGLAAHVMHLRTSQREISQVRHLQADDVSGSLKEADSHRQTRSDVWKYWRQMEKLLFTRKEKRRERRVCAGNSVFRILDIEVRGKGVVACGCAYQWGNTSHNGSSGHKRGSQLPLSFVTMLAPALPPGNPYRRAYRCDRKDRLHPSGPFSLGHAGRPVVNRQKAVFGGHRKSLTPLRVSRCYPEQTTSKGAIAPMDQS